jgi:RND family efflux transporter MFP subunit
VKKLLLLLLALVSGCEDQVIVEPEEQAIRPARLMTVSRESAHVLHEFAGRIEAARTIDVSFEVAGPLNQLLVREGQSIPEGTLIASLDSTDFELAVREAEVQLQLAAQDLRRKQRVLEDNAIAKSVVQDAKSLYELQLVRLKQARERLADTSVHAPFDGYVSRRFIDNHVNINPSDPVVRLHDLAELLVVVSIPENLLATVNEDQLVRAWVELSFAPGRQFELSYRENRGEAEALVQTYEVSFAMENPGDLTLLPGMTARVSILLSGLGEGYILLPASALVSGADNATAVWVFDPATGFVSRRTVRTGSPQQSGVPILSGLVDGDQVVTTGASQLQAGMRIKPLERR